MPDARALLGDEELLGGGDEELPGCFGVPASAASSPVPTMTSIPVERATTTASCPACRNALVA